jgi:hypothetical protein
VLLGQIQGVLAEYEAHLPLTIRQVFYRLVAGGYAKTIESYRRVQRCLALARRAEMIPFPSIRDDGASYAPGAGERYGNTSPAGYVSGVEQELRDLLSWNHYRRGAHEGQPYEIEVWCEAAGMIPQLSRVVAPYGVGAYSCGGYDSVTEKKKGAERYAQRDVPTVLLHVGDYDKDGLQIFDALVEDIEAFIRRDGGEFEAVRVAITPEQIEEYGLPSFKGAVQAEALPPDALARLVEAAVLEYYDLDIAAKVRERERAERTEVDRLLAELRERVQLPDEDSDGQA